MYTRQNRIIIKPIMILPVHFHLGAINKNNQAIVASILLILKICDGGI